MGCVPLFFNYRFYFKPDKRFSPHINVAAGGFIAYGIYSSISAGFRTGDFSLSAGFSFTPCYEKFDEEWRYPFGASLKIGFASSAYERKPKAGETVKPVRYSNITEIGLILAGEGGLFGLTTVNGISINRKHLIGVGLGLGLGDITHVDEFRFFPDGYAFIYANYRIYFKPDKNFSPFINLAAGVALEMKTGVYSSITGGFRYKYFSLTGGLANIAIPCTCAEWHYPFGFSLKIGFTLY